MVGPPLFGVSLVYWFSRNISIRLNFDFKARKLHSHRCLVTPFFFTKIFSFTYSLDFQQD